MKSLSTVSDSNRKLRDMLHEFREDGKFFSYTKEDAEVRQAVGCQQKRAIAGQPDHQLRGGQSIPTRIFRSGPAPGDHRPTVLVIL